MATKDEEKERLKRMQSALLDGSGLNAVKVASQSSTAAKANQTAAQQSAGRAAQQKQQAANDALRAKKAASDQKKIMDATVTQSAGRTQQQAQQKANANIRAQRSAPKITVNRPKTAAEEKLIQGFQQDWQDAKARGDQAAMKKAHESAEAVRAARGYSGGQNGAKNLPTLTGGADADKTNMRLALAALGLKETSYSPELLEALRNEDERKSFLKRAAMTADASNLNLQAGLMSWLQTDTRAVTEKYLNGEELSLLDRIVLQNNWGSGLWGENWEEALAPYKDGGAKAGERQKMLDTVYGDGGRMAAASGEMNRQARAGAGRATGVALDVIGTGADMLGRTALSGGDPLTYRTLSFVTGSGSKAQEAIDEGYDAGTAQKFGLASGAVSAAIEGIGGVGASDLAGEVVEKIAPKLTETMGKTAAGRILANAASEGFEEFVEEPAGTLLRNRILGAGDKTDWKQAAYNAAIGALMGGVFGSVQEAEGRGRPAQLTQRDGNQSAQTGRIVNQTAESQAVGQDDAGRLTTGIDADPATHTEEQMKGIRAYVAAADQRVKSFFERYRNDPRAKFSRMTISPASARQAADVSRLLGGDYTGYVNAIDRNGVLHILNRHGANGEADSSMADLNDAARIGYVLDEYDSVDIARTAAGEPDVTLGYKDKNNAPAPLVKFEKKIDGSYYVVEAVPDSSYKKMWVVSAYIAKNSGDSYASAIDAHDVSTSAPSSTSTTLLPSPVSADSSIAQGDQNVNQNGENAAAPEPDTGAPEVKGGTLRYLHRNIVSGVAEIERFAKEQAKANPKAANATDLMQISRSVAGTVDAIAETGMVDRAGTKIGKSWKEIAGGLTEEQSKRLNLYRQHLHNIDRMGFEARAEIELEALRKEISVFRENNPELAVQTEVQLRELTHNWDVGREVRASAEDYLALLEKEKELSSVRNKPVLAKKNDQGELVPYTAAESQDIVTEMLREHPELAEQTKAAEGFHDQFMREWVVESGMMTEEQYERLRAQYPHYIQTFRTDYRSMRGDSVTRKGGVNTTEPIKKAVGDIGEIVPFEDAEMMQINSIIRMVRRNELFQNIYSFAKNRPKDAAPYVRILGEDTEIDTNPTGGIEALSDSMDKGAMRAEGGAYTITAMVDGKPVKMEVNADFYAGLQNLYGQDRGAVNEFLNSTIGKANTAFKAVTTGLNPTFPITNFAKDIQTGYINTVSDTPLFLTYVGQVGGALFDMKRNSTDWQVFQALGGKDSGYYHNEKGFRESESMSKLKGLQGIKNAKSLKDAGAWGWENFKDLLTLVGENGEAVMRFAEYKAGVKKYGDTQAGRAKAIQAAADVTVNFSRSAPAAKTAETFVPYLNASIQGLDKMARQIKEHPVQLTRRNLEMLTATTLLLWMVNKDDEDYQNLNDRTKDNYFCIPLDNGVVKLFITPFNAIQKIFTGEDIDVEGKFLKIPKSREWGVIFSALTERFLRALPQPEEDDGSAFARAWGALAPNTPQTADRAFRGIGSQFLTNIIPSNPVTDNIFKTVFIDLPNNTDFAGRSIVPERLLGLSPENQYDYTTSALGKAVAKGWNKGAGVLSMFPGVDVPKVSPIQVDYLIDANTGFVGDLALAYDPVKGVQSVNPAVWFKDTLAQKFTADPLYQNGATDYFYELLDAAEVAKNDANLAAGVTSRMKTPEEVYYSTLNDASSEISELRKQERAILSSDLDEAAQEEQVRAIRRQILDIANAAPAAAKEAMEEYQKTYVPEISHLSDEKQAAARKAHSEVGLSYDDFARFTDDLSEYTKENKGKEKDAAADVAEMLRGYQTLTDEQRDALYQVYSDNMEKNPFHISVYEAEMDTTTGLYSEMTEMGRMRIRALLNDYEQDIREGKAENKKLDGWKAKAYMAEQEAEIAPSMYSQYRIALEIANTDGNSNYSQAEAERAIRMLSGLSTYQKAYLFASTNSQWKNNPFGSATVTRFETAETSTGTKNGAKEYLMEDSTLWDTLTAQASETDGGSSGKSSTKVKKPKTLETLNVLKPLKNLF